MVCEAKKSAPDLRFHNFNTRWCNSKLGEISQVRTGPFGSLLHQSDYVSTGTPIITVEHLGETGIEQDNLPLVSDEDKDRLKSYILEEGDIVFSRVGSVDRNSYVSDKENGWLFSGRLLRIRVNKKELDSKYLSFNFQVAKTKHRVRSVAVGQTMPSLNTEILNNFSIDYPSLEEQQKIAAFLGSVDDKLSKLRRKRELLETWKRGLMQKIFSQEISFAAHGCANVAGAGDCMDAGGRATSGTVAECAGATKQDDGGDFPDWEEKTLGELSERRTIKNTDDSISRVLTNSATQGVLDQGDYFDKDIANSDNLAGYYVVELGDYIYNPRISASAPVGPINKNKIGKGVMSPLYSVFRFKENSNKFYEYYFHSNSWHKYMYSVANYGARYDRMNITASDFMGMPLPYPHPDEQQKIADFLSYVDKKIETVANKITQIETFKKGLLQKMFV